MSDRRKQMEDNFKKVFNTRTKASRDDWGTPQIVFDKIQDFLKVKFTLDPCASDENHKCEKYYTKDDDGLTKWWLEEKVFINPPYKEKQLWFDLACETIDFPHVDEDNMTYICFLIPAVTDTKLFHELIWENASEIYFLKGRVNFEDPEGKRNSNNHGSMLIIFNSESRYNDWDKPPKVGVFDWKNHKIGEEN